jgi:hypothetical protein
LIRRALVGHYPVLHRRAMREVRAFARYLCELVRCPAALGGPALISLNRSQGCGWLYIIQAGGRDLVEQVEGVVASQLIIGVTEWAVAASTVVCFCLVLRLGVMSQCLSLTLPGNEGAFGGPCPAGVA